MSVVNPDSTRTEASTKNACDKPGAMDNTCEESMIPTAESIERPSLLSKIGSFLTGKTSNSDEVDVDSMTIGEGIKNNPNEDFKSSDNEARIILEDLVPGEKLSMDLVKNAAESSNKIEESELLNEKTAAENNLGVLKINKEVISLSEANVEEPSSKPDVDEESENKSEKSLEKELKPIHKAEELTDIQNSSDDTQKNGDSRVADENLDSSQNDYETNTSDYTSTGADDTAPSLEDSEYETPEPEEEEDKELSEDEDTDSAGESSAESQVLTEREDGDGQESEKKEKKLDHDEDKRDPQYIPKKGNFYEHDDRTSETEEAPPKKTIPAKSFDKEGRWGHDLYDPDAQSPKSREELIDQYGYDIRDEEGPPKARRRRRYGRGPNKYTRHWEEEEAYTKTRGSWRGRGRGRPLNAPRKTDEEFPPLPTKEIQKEERVNERKTSEEVNAETIEMKRDKTPQGGQKKIDNRRTDHQQTPSRDHEPPKRHDPRTPPQPRKPRQGFAAENNQSSGPHPPIRGRGRGRGRLPPGSVGSRGPPPGTVGGPAQQRLQQFQLSSREQSKHTMNSNENQEEINAEPGLKTLKQVLFEEMGSHVSIGRGRRVPTLQEIQDEKYKSSHYKSTAEEDIATLSQHFSEAVINVDNKSFVPPQQPRKGSPPSAPSPQQQSKQQEKASEKRNQQTVDENQPKPVVQTQNPPTPVQQMEEAPSTRNHPSHHHEKEAKSKRYSTQRQRSLPQGTAPPGQPPPAQPHFIQDQFFTHGPPPPTMDAPVPAPPPSAVPPPQFAPQQPPPPPPGSYAPEVPMMAFIPPGGQFPPLYCPPPAYLPPAPIPVPVNQLPQAPPPRPEVYQGASGITYYNTQNQVSRPAQTSRRVKLAIPIVAPPEGTN